MILSTILHLDNERGCYATNDWLAEKCGCARRTIIRAVNALTECGLISSAKDGKRRVLYLVNNATTDQNQECQNVTPTVPNCHPNSAKLSPQECQNVTHNSIVSTTTEQTVKREVPYLLERVRLYRMEKIRRGDRVPDSVTAEKFCEYYDACGWKTNTGRSIADKDRWKLTFDNWCNTERAYGEYAKEGQHGSFDTDEFFENACAKSYGEDAPAALEQFNNEHGRKMTMDERERLKEEKRKSELLKEIENGRKPQ